MEDQRLVKGIYKWKPMGTRAAGRPKIRGEDDIANISERRTRWQKKTEKRAMKKKPQAKPAGKEDLCKEAYRDRGTAEKPTEKRYCREVYRGKGTAEKSTEEKVLQRSLQRKRYCREVYRGKGTAEKYTEEKVLQRSVQRKRYCREKVVQISLQRKCTAEKSTEEKVLQRSLQRKRYCREVYRGKGTAEKYTQEKVLQRSLQRKRYCREVYRGKGTAEKSTEEKVLQRSLQRKRYCREVYRGKGTAEKSTEEKVLQRSLQRKGNADKQRKCTAEKSAEKSTEEKVLQRSLQRKRYCREVYRGKGTAEKSTEEKVLQRSLQRKRYRREKVVQISLQRKCTAEVYRGKCTERSLQRKRYCREVYREKVLQRSLQRKGTAEKSTEEKVLQRSLQRIGTAEKSTEKRYGRNAYEVLIGRPEGKRPLGKPIRGWEDNIKMDLREVGYDRDWINLAQEGTDGGLITIVNAFGTAESKSSNRLHLRCVLTPFLDHSPQLKSAGTASASCILTVVLYGCETWTVTLREEEILRVFENKVLWKIFGAERDEVTGEWRKLHNAELHALYSSPDIIRNIKSRRFRWAGHVSWETRGKKTFGEAKTRDVAATTLTGVLCVKSTSQGFIRRNEKGNAVCKKGVKSRVQNTIQLPLETLFPALEKAEFRNLPLPQQGDERCGLRKAIYGRSVFVRDNYPQAVLEGEMSPGSSTNSYPAFSRIGLKENPGKNLNQITCPDRDLNPVHLVPLSDALTVTPQL
ncbi:hypothetical protein ANN_23508 [Periplaneta americana]|uniref:Uncharacterized protein n=1 Tax=Periplaneta americana TaxID=6978 RepID=A0ABQ8SLA7_PERAM|nr:hypothetical protein ANN_23508 [Periplaneta americana]